MPSGILDQRTGMAVSISGDHHYIHNGIAFVLCGNTASIAASGVEHIYFKTPAASKGVIHFRPSKIASTANSLSVTMIEDAVMTGGTAATPQCLNRLPGQKRSSSVTVTTAATLTTAGTGGTIYLDAVGSGGASNRAGGDGAAAEERILKPDTVYQITFTNIGSSTATVGYYQLFWYEEKR